MKTAIIRGKYFNRFEMQNYEPIAKQAGLVGFSSLYPMHEGFCFPVKKLFSPMDLPNFPRKMSILNRLFTDALYLPTLEQKLTGFDIAHVRETYFRITQQGIRAKNRELVKKIICTCSETIPFNHEGISGRKEYKKRAYNEVDLFHCLTSKAKNCLIKEGVSSKKISVVGYGINIDVFKPQIRANKKRDTINLLYVGRLVPEKGILYLLNAFSLLHKSYSNIRLKVVGKGGLKNQLSRQIKLYGLQNRINISTYTYQNMPEVYNSADIFVLPSYKTKYWEEYYGMALLEAMASGLAVIATDCGAIPEVTGGKIEIVKQKSCSSLANGIKKFLVAPGMIKTRQKTAYQWAKKNFDAKKQSIKILQLYKNLLKE
jgi:glycosyltransferase involved in cell wall biosynthesis